MESTNRPMADMNHADAQSATWYWDTLGETNRHMIDYMKSLTVMMWHANPMTVLTPMVRENGNRAAEMLAASAQQAQRNNEQFARRTNETVDTPRKAAAPKATRRHATSARNGRRSK
jgi:hypothetical protein